MKSSVILIWILFGLYLFGQTTPPSPKLQDTREKTLNGEFVGMEEIKDYEPGKKWFHENSLLIKNGEVLRPFESDYIAFPIAVRDPCDPYSKVTVVAAEMTKRGLVIDGVLYRSKALSHQKREQLSEWLQSEPMEYNGERPYRPDLELPACH